MIVPMYSKIVKSIVKRNLIVSRHNKVPLTINIQVFKRPFEVRNLIFDLELSFCAHMANFNL